MVVLRYKPRKPELEIVKHFGEKACQASAYAGEIPSGPSVFLCFTNRSGSNFVASCLQGTENFKRIGETFNWPVVVNKSTAAGFRSFPEYCVHVKRIMAGDQGAFASKIGWHQLFFLRRVGILDAIFPDRKYVLIRRRDILAQAISHAIAMQTRKFRSSHSGVKIDPEYNFAEIAGIVRSISMSNAFLYEFFAITDTPYFEIVYEDFVGNPAMRIDMLCQWLSLPSKTLDTDKIELSVQRNEVNETFRKRFLEDMEKAMVDIGGSSIPRLLY